MTRTPHSKRLVLRALLAAPLASGLAACAQRPAAPPPATAATTAPHLQGLGRELDGAFQAGALRNLHAVVVMRGGQVLLERYYAGTDERWGTKLGTVAFDAQTLHDVRSISKSVMGLLYGMALAEGKVPALDAALVDQFPALADLAKDPRRRQIKVRHALTMTMGTEWNENVPYTSTRNSEIAMEEAPDRIRYVLDRPLVAEPGKVWNYNGGGTALLGHLITRGTGQPLQTYAEAKLFKPLGIRRFDWVKGSNGEPAAASGLRFTAPDVARFGQLVLQKGQWNGQQLVPAAWIDTLTTQSAVCSGDFEGLNYGAHWFLSQRRDGSKVIIGVGNGGQRLFIVPSLDLAFVVLTGNYNQPDQLKVPMAVMGMVYDAVH